MAMAMGTAEPVAPKAIQKASASMIAKYSWLPEGLNDEQIELYFASLPEHKRPVYVYTYNVHREIGGERPRERERERERDSARARERETRETHRWEREREGNYTCNAPRVLDATHRDSSAMINF